jgi:hypothetical protein
VQVSEINEISCPYIVKLLQDSLLDLDVSANNDLKSWSMSAVEQLSPDELYHFVTNTNQLPEALRGEFSQRSIEKAQQLRQLYALTEPYQSEVPDFFSLRDGILELDELLQVHIAAVSNYVGDDDYFYCFFLLEVITTL